MAIYQAYLLRLWLTEAEASGNVGWRASLEDSHTGERWGFASLEQLFAFLMTVAESKVGNVQELPPDANQPPI